MATAIILLQLAIVLALIFIGARVGGIGRFVSKHPTPMAILLHPQCLLGIQSILRNWTFLIFKQV